MVSATQERAALADERERIQIESDRINLERLKVQLEVDRATLVNKQLQNQKTKLEITQLEQLLGIQNIVIFLYLLMAPLALKTILISNVLYHSTPHKL